MLMSMCFLALNDQGAAPEIPASQAKQVKLLGRWGWENAAAKGQWPAVGLHFTYQGKKLEISMEDSADGSPNQAGGTNSNAINVTINNLPPKVITLKPGRHTYTLIDESSPVKSEVKIIKRTESSVGWIKWHSLIHDEQGKLMAKPKTLPRLDVYGDSNSCGYGVEAPNKEVRYSPSTQNAEIAFGALTAKSLGMDLHLTSLSGWGIMRGYGGETEANVPRVHDRIWFDQPKTHEDVQPAAILVQLGDNDFAKGDPGSAFDDAYLAFAEKLHAAHPKAPMFLCVGTAMSGATRARVAGVIDKIAVKIGAGFVNRVDISPYNGEKEGFGADWHHSRTGQVRISSEMAAAISKVIKQSG